MQGVPHGYKPEGCSNVLQGTGLALVIANWISPPIVTRAHFSAAALARSEISPVLGPRGIYGDVQSHKNRCL